ncbi:MAG TPA: NAD(P)H-dependent oxidoreductase [Hyphomicrobiaceae bacterium]|nr:NAD(P)H-dependent oxidoreductase [Hyphomicrobiaceae bacterium]
MATIKILGIAGSLRKGSFNRAALRAAQGLVPAGATLEAHDLPDLPGFDQDKEKTPPAAVTELKAKIRAADAVLLVTPEYNYSVPGVLKNAIDWASRPYGDSAWKGKPVAIMGASAGVLGTARAQYHLRQTLVFLDMPAVNQPEVMIGAAATKFDQAGNLTDETAKKLIGQLLTNLCDLAKRHGAGA